MVEKEFYRIIKDIVRSEEYRGMKDCKHHIKELGQIFIKLQTSMQ